MIFNKCKESTIMAKILSVIIFSCIALMLTGCGEPKPPMTRIECQQSYDTNKENALDKYEECSKSKCDGRVIMEQGQDPCTTECFETIKGIRADLDATLEDCMAQAVN